MNNLIELQNVSVIRNKRTILKNINWTVKKNENWAIIGKNGSGKSFLLRLLSANFQPTSGIVKLFNQQFGKVNLWDLKKKIGFISDLFQKIYDQETRVLNVIYSGFFSSNGLYEDPDETMKQKTKEILNFLNIFNLKDRFFGELSHGEQRKVLIARALVFDPKLLVFDEPCTGLDIASREDFLNTIEKLIKKGHNIIFVTHHIEEIIPSINKILLLKDGEIFKFGDKNKMMKNKNLNEVLSYKFKIKEKSGRFWGKFY